MTSYYESLPIYRAAMDTAVRVDAAVQRFPKRTRLANLFEPFSPVEAKT